MPVSIRERSQRLDYYTGFIRYAVLGAVLYYLAYRYEVGASELGFVRNRFLVATVIGFLVGVFLGGAKIAGAVATKSRLKDLYGLDLIRSWILLEVLSDLATSFGEELWRVFCIVSLVRSGHSTYIAVGLTALVFGLIHALRPSANAWERLGSGVGSFVSGIIFALLFLWVDSFLAPFVAHLGSNTLLTARMVKEE